MASKHGYLKQDELAQYADITILDVTEADDQISQAEEIIDGFVGFQEKFFGGNITGLAVGGSTSTVQLQTDQQNVYEKDYFKDMTVEIIGGAGIGDRKKVTGSTKAGVLTTETFSAAIDTTSFYKIYQLGKFPRFKDVTYYDQNGTVQYFKSIPEMVKRATAAQVEYMINKGAAFFASDKYSFSRERIDDYEYERGNTPGGPNQLIAPKAKIYLRGIRNLVGQFT